ncbi:MAG: STAS domain-containing protein [Spirochaetes bacterium]|nr:MAG: STAS domain-containing protein [Spirochaetota bacterium]
MGTFRLAEDTGIKKIRELHASWRDIIDGNEEIILDFSAVRRLDLASIQVILAGAREARERSLAVRMRGANEEVRAQLQLCGLR